MFVSIMYKKIVNNLDVEILCRQVLILLSCLTGLYSKMWEAA